MRSTTQVGLLLIGLGATNAAGQGDAARAYSAQALADAQGRASLLTAQATAAPKISGYVQFRYNFNVRDNVPGGNDSTNGFQTARTVLRATGSVNDEIGYFVQGRFRHADAGDFFLDDAFGTYKADDDWTIQWGQFRLPVLREESTAEVFQLGAERSVMNSVFNQGRSQGATAKYQGEEVRFQFGVSDGLRTVNTDFDSVTEADFGLTARGDWKWAGDWDRFKDFTSWSGAEYAGTVGAAIHWQSGGETAGTADVDLLVVTVDTSAEGDGWNAYAAGVWRNTDAGSGSDFDDFGWLFQGGYFVASDWELFGRWDQVFPDSDRTAGATFSTLTVGLNHYVIPESHAAKVTVGFSYFPTAQSESSSIVSPSTFAGLLASAEDGQWNLMAQVQLMY